MAITPMFSKASLDDAGGTSGMPSRRRWLHRSSLIIALAATLPLVVVAGAGNASYFGRFVSSVTLRHGWPWVFFERRVDWNSEWWNPNRNDEYPPKGLGGIPWLASTAWNFGAGQREEVNWMAGLADFVVLGSWCIAIAAIAEWRRRGRTYVLQISLTELLMALSLATMGMGWMAWSRRIHQIERACITELENPFIEGNGLIYVYDECTAPEFVQRLLGDDLLPECLWRADEASITYFEEIWPIDAAWIQRRLVKLQRLRTIELDGIEPISMAAMLSQLAKLPQLRTLDLQNFYELRIDARHATNLAAMTQLREIVLSNRGQLDANARAILAQGLPYCTIRFVDDDLEQ